MKNFSVVLPAIRFGIGLVFFVFLIGGCGGGGYSPGTTGYPMTVSLSSKQITPNTSTIMSGTTAALTAIGRYSDGTTANITALVTWTSAAPATASVEQLGRGVR